MFSNNSSFPYGTVLKVQREYSMKEIYNHMDKIKELGMNYIVVWPAVYWWENKNLTNYPYHTGHKILEYAEKLDLNIIMELAGQLPSLEYAPDFIMKKEYYAVNYDGTYKRVYIPYDVINYNHPEIKQLIKKQYSEIASNYNNYSSLYGYDIWNETMFTSYDKYTLQLFRKWLKGKYTSIDELNNVWDKVYYDWSQITFEKRTWASVMPVVDYEQFHKENIGIILNEWANIIKSVDPDHPVIADNIASMITMDSFYEGPQDDWNVAENVDEMGISFYPKNEIPPMKSYRRWETLAAIHSANPKGFWISELQSHHQAMFNPFSAVAPHEIKWWNWEAISNGAKGIIYWKWTPFTKGIQTFGRGLVDPKGNYTKRSQEVARIVKIIRENEKAFINYKPEEPKVAILYDKLNLDFSKAYTVNYKPFISDSIYLDSIAGLYKCLWNHNLPAKFVVPQDIINNIVNKYKILFVTNQLNIGNDMAMALKQYVKNGGILICSGRCGVINNQGFLHKDIPGGPLNKNIGCSLVDVESTEEMQITLQEEMSRKLIIDGYYEKQILKLDDNAVQILGEFDDNSPAIISSKLEKGRIIYIGTYLWYGYFRENYSSVNNFMGNLSKKYEMSIHTVNNNDLKIKTLKGDNGYILFVFNYNEDKINSTVEMKQIQASKIILKDICNDFCTELSILDKKLLFDVEVKGKDINIYRIKIVE